MVKKVTPPAEKQLAQTVKESAQQIWLAGLGAFAKTQEEGTKVFDALVKEGEAIQKKTRKSADEKIADVRKVADGKLAGVRKAVDAKVAAVTGKVTAVTDKASGKWDSLEKVFEDRVARALSSLGVPSKKDIDRLTRRITELTALVQKMSDAQEGKVAKPAARTTAAPATAQAAAPKAAPVRKPAATKSVAAGKPAESADAAAGAAIAS